MTVDSRSFSLMISLYPLIYHPTYPCPPSSPPLSFSYSLSAIPHFNLGKIHSSWKAEQQNINSSQTIWWDVWTGDQWFSGQVNPRCQLQNNEKKMRWREKETERNSTKLWRQSVSMALVQENEFKCEYRKGKDQRRHFVLMRAALGKTICWWYHDRLENMSHSYFYHHPVFPLEWRVLPSAASTIISWCPVFAAFKRDLTTSSFR